MVGSEQVLVNDWCQQYPSHSIGDLVFGPDGRSTSPAARAPPSTRTTTARAEAPATRRRGTPAVIRRAGGRRDPPTAEGGRCAQPEIFAPAGSPVNAGRDLAPRSHHGRRAAGQPATPAAPTRTRGGSSPTGCGTRSASPSGPARARSGSATWAGHLGGDQPASPRRRGLENFGWPCYEGAGRQSGYQSAGLNLCRPVQPAGRRRAALFRVRPQRARRRGRQLPDRNGSSITGLGFYPAAPTRRVRRRPLLRRLYAQLHLGDAAGANGLPTPPTFRHSWPGAANPVDLETGPAATSSTSTSTAARSTASPTRWRW